MSFWSLGKKKSADCGEIHHSEFKIYHFKYKIHHFVCKFTDLRRRKELRQGREAGRHLGGVCEEERPHDGLAELAVVRLARQELGQRQAAEVAQRVQREREPARRDAGLRERIVDPAEQAGQQRDALLLRLRGAGAEPDQAPDGLHQLQRVLLVELLRRVRAQEAVLQNSSF